MEHSMKKLFICLLFTLFFIFDTLAQSFSFKDDQFILDGKPFQIIAGEMHSQRIPHQYWKDRLMKAKAMGLNSIATYIFWNCFEPLPGKWDFTENNNLREFILAAKEIGLFIMLRPGPYACAEWDFGGLPPWLLSIPDIKVRCMDERYMSAVEKYINKIADLIKDLQCTRGGPIIMLQIENEYGSYGNDKEYLNTIKNLWRKAGIDIPFNTADGATPYMLEAGTVPGAAIGLDPATNDRDFAEAYKLKANVPIFCSEYYPGWLTHWGEKWVKVETDTIIKDLKWYMDNKKSFSLYVIHGGTNFGWMAGANMTDVYMPDITSYDYDAPINERGDLTPKYHTIRNLLGKYLPKGKKLPDLPKPLPAINISEIKFDETSSIFDNLVDPVKSVQPKPIEYFNQYYGFILYKTKLIGHHSGKLLITNLNDYATIYVDGKYIGSIDRSKNQNSIDIPVTDKLAETLEIFVEAMGRINFGQHLIDRKGITERVSLNGMTLMNWEVYNLPMDSKYISNLKFTKNIKNEKPGIFFKGTFDLQELGDTFLDMSQWKKGIVWVNGFNLGRFWEIGPQQRLFLPATVLRKGKNEIVVFDLHQKEPSGIKGYTELK
jgi:beta-galactosidase